MLKYYEFPTLITELRSFANNRDGACLSKKCKSLYEELTWICRAGHRFEASPYLVLHGNWCPLCGRKYDPATPTQLKCLA